MTAPWCLIVGGTSDLGRFLAKNLADKGYNLYLTAREASSFDLGLSSELSERFSIHIQWISYDALVEEAHYSILNALKYFPEIVIVSHGYLGDQTRASLDDSESLKIIQINFCSQVFLLNHIANHMEKRGHGIIVGISSIAGTRGRSSNYLYGAAKAAFTTYLSGLRNRLYTSNVHVTTVIPGYINTKMIAHLKTPHFLTASPESAARSITHAIRRKKNIIYISPIWRGMALILQLIPEWFFKRIKL